MAQNPPTAIRYTPRDVRYLKLLSGSGVVSQGAAKALQLLRNIEAHGLKELRGVFTPGEWHILASVLKGYNLDDATNATQLVSLIDVPDIGQQLTHFGVDINDLREKAFRLNCAQVFALMRRVQDYWDTTETHKSTESAEVRAKCAKYVEDWFTAV